MLNQGLIESTAILGMAYNDTVKTSLTVIAQALEVGDYDLATIAIASVANISDEVGRSIGTTAILNASTEAEIRSNGLDAVERYVDAMNRLKPGIMQMRTDDDG